MSTRVKSVEDAHGVEREFMDALNRLLTNRPRTPALSRLAKLGQLRISVSTVAQEASRSRTLIGHDGCRYPRVRAAVLAAKQPVAGHRTAAETILALREEVANLRRAVKLRDTVNAALVLRLDDLERASLEKVDRAHRIAERAEKRAQPNQVAGRRLLDNQFPERGQTVVPFSKEKSSDD